MFLKDHAASHVFWSFFLEGGYSGVTIWLHPTTIACHMIKFMQCNNITWVWASWVEPDFRYLRREVGIHSNTQTCTRRQKSGGTNQIAVSASGPPTQSTLPPTSCQWHTLDRRNHGKNSVGQRIAGPP